MELTLKMGELQEKAEYNVLSNTLLIKNLTREDLGYWQLEMHVDELRGGQKFSYRRQFYIIIVDEDDPIVKPV